jgi:hypothetical protein
MNELKKLFERYKNVFNKEFGEEHLPERDNDEE